MLQRLRKLRSFGARIVLFAPEGAAETEGVSALLLRRLEREDLAECPAFVAAAGLDRRENERISGLCREVGIPVNVADVPELCSFFFPAVLQRGALTVAVGTDGGCPTAAVLLRDRLAQSLPEQTEQIMDWAQTLRGELRRSPMEPGRRNALLRLALERALEADRPLSEEEVQALAAGMEYGAP